MSNIFKSLKDLARAAILGLIMVVGVSLAQAAWTSAPASPPNSNVDAPINTSATTQYKRGRLELGTNGASTYMLEVYGAGDFGALSVGGNSLFNGDIQIVNGPRDQLGNLIDKTGYVLTSSDAFGNAVWRAPGGSGSVSIITCKKTYGSAVTLPAANGFYQYLFRASDCSSGVLPGPGYIGMQKNQHACQQAGNLIVLNPGEIYTEPTVAPNGYGSAGPGILFNGNVQCDNSLSDYQVVYIKVS